MWQKLMEYLGFERGTAGDTASEPAPELPLDPVLSLKLQLLLDGPILLLVAKLIFWHSLSLFFSLIHL